MNFALDYRTRLFSTLDTIDLAKVEELIELFRRARDEDRQIFFCGNGGSAATANHIVCDIVKGASLGKPKRFRVMALSESIPTMTAYANDIGYEVVFAEQLKNFARSGDVVVAVSGSGNSPNVLRALECASEIGCRTVALTGRDGGKLAPLADLNIHVADDHMGRIEDGHMVVLHMLAYYFMESDGSK